MNMSLVVLYFMVLLYSLGTNMGMFVLIFVYGDDVLFTNFNEIKSRYRWGGKNFIV